MTERSFKKEEVVQALRQCQQNCYKACVSCPYYGVDSEEDGCFARLVGDVLSLIGDGEEKGGTNEGDR